MSTEHLKDPKEQPELLADFSNSRKDKILCCVNYEKRIQSYAAGLLLKKVLKIHEKKEEDIRIDANGKPVMPGFYFNLSHTEGLAVCAVGDRELGCDVEKIREVPKRVSVKAFTETEKATMGDDGKEQYRSSFYRLWTLKESYLKMTGEGIRLPLNLLEIREEGALVLRREGKKENCFFQEYKYPGYHISVCCREDGFSAVPLLLS